jgi:hypothetical protein
MRKHIGGDASGAALEKVRVAVVLRQQRLDFSPIVGIEAGVIEEPSPLDGIDLDRILHHRAYPPPALRVHPHRF